MGQAKRGAVRRLLIRPTNIAYRVPSRSEIAKIPRRFAATLISFKSSGLDIAAAEGERETRSHSRSQSPQAPARRTIDQELPESDSFKTGSDKRRNGRTLSEYHHACKEQQHRNHGGVSHQNLLRQKKRRSSCTMSIRLATFSRTPLISSLLSFSACLFQSFSMR